MAGGSTDREGENDRQCVHCGLWYDRLGVHEHENSCRLRDYDRRLVDLEDTHAVMRADDVSLEDLERGDPDAGEVDEDLPDAITDGETYGAFVAEVGEPADEPADDGADVARTDGGPQAVPSGWEAADPDPEPDLEADDDDDDNGCPACGSLDWFDPDDLVEQYGAKLPDDLVDELRGADRACAPCSTDDVGMLSQSVEVYDV